MLIKESDGSISFIDKNDAFVDFDYTQDCCECFGWYVASEPATESNLEYSELTEHFWFDTTTEPVAIEDLDDEEGGIIAFKCTNGAIEVWLHLYNYHNGYYGHGWNASWCEGGCL